jgi:hypothetical protein
MMMSDEPEIAFASTSEPPPLEIRVNFGVYAGRGATPAEIDDLARALLPQVGEVSIVSEERHEISDGVEASLHQVRVEVAGDHLPSSPAELADLTDALVDEAARWARACVAERHTETAEL